MISEQSKINTLTSYRLMKSVFVDFSWDEVIKIDLSSEFETPNSPSNYAFWILLKNATDSFKKLSDDEREHFMGIASLQSFDFLASINVRLNQCLTGINDLNIKYSPFHFSVNFSQAADEMLETIKLAVSALYHSTSIKGDKNYHISNFKWTQAALLYHHKDALNFLDSKSLELAIRESISVWTSFSIDDFLVECEKRYLEKFVNSPSVSPANIITPNLLKI